MKKAIIVFSILVLLIIVTLTTFITTNIQSFAEMSHYQKVSFDSAVVKADILNVRLGPGMNYPVVTKVYQGEILRIYAKINEWYIIQNNSNCVGMVRQDFISPSNGSDKTVKSNTADKSNIAASNIAPEVQQLLDLVNQTRKNSGVKMLKLDSILMKISDAKVENMVNNNYFSHNSTTYGSPFDMMKRYGVKYRAAGENIAGNPTVKGAFDAWMKSEGHRKNILNRNFNYTGIGMAESKTYGKIFVQQFVGR